MANINNSITQDDVSALLNTTIAQMRGGAIANLSTGECISIAQTALRNAPDSLLNAISQTLSKTIFSVRPYTARLQLLDRDAIRWGNHVRKINFCDSELIKDAGAPEAIVDGSSIDPWVAHKQNILQTNFYSKVDYAKEITIWKNQLNSAFDSGEQFGSFAAGVVNEAKNLIEESREAYAEDTLINLIGGVTKCGKETQQIHLITLYNAETGAKLTANSVFAPGNFVSFIGWLSAKILEIRDHMERRNHIYSCQITGKPIARFTPRAEQRLVMLSSFVRKITGELLNVFNPDRFDIGGYEVADYWQSLASPDTITATLSYINTADGTVVTDSESTTVSKVVGVLFDTDAAGVTLCDEEVGVSPYNQKGKYWNQTWSYALRGYNDFTEQAVVLLLD